MIAVNQHSTYNRPLIPTDATVIWSAKPEDGKGHYLAIFNRGESVQNINLGWNEVGLVLGRVYSLRDVWRHEELVSATSLNLTLQPHACVLYLVSE